MTRFWLLLTLTVGALAASAGVANAALPRTWDVQRVDSPHPTVGGDFGIGFVSAGDLNRDGRDDLIVGTDEHGGGPGEVFLISGADGSAIRTLTAPDPGGTGTPSSFGSYVGKIADIGSCPGGQASATCPSFGPPDGVPDLLVTALGVDVPIPGTDKTLADAGRAYVIDGATGGVLKRLDMPASDLTEQANAPGGAAKPALGRTILNPSSQYGPTASDGSGPTTPPEAIRIGDMNGGGKPDIVVGASDYFETGKTANPISPCALAGADAQCLQAGRAYVYYGESIAGTDPSVIDNQPDLVIKNPTAQPDDLVSPVNFNRESMGYSVAPVGDLGKCNTSPGPGQICPNAKSTATPDGKADVVISSHRTDEFGMMDVGVAYLIDGATGSVLYTYHHPEPQPASIFAFTNYNQPAVGDLGSSSQPDVYLPAMRQNNPFTGGGKGYVMNGNFKQGGSPNSIAFATFVDPTPNASEDFGTSSAGIGNVDGDGRTEILIGAYGPHNPGTNQTVINDVHIMSALTERSLRDIPDPDPQAGSGFGTALAPLGDLNGDGFLDFAVGAGLYDGTTGADQGRIYIFRSNNAPATRTVTLSARPTTVRRAGAVTLAGEVQLGDAADCASAVSVVLERRLAGQKSFHAFKTMQTQTGGRFSTGIRPTKTGVYRARTDGNATCGAAASNAVKVSVKSVKKVKRLNPRKRK